MTTPAPSQGSLPRVAPEIGLDALRDAIAAIRCSSAGDAEGVYAVLAGSDAPRHVAWVLTAVTVVLCRRVGLSSDDIAALLNEISTDFTNSVLDQPRPELGNEGG